MAIVRTEEINKYYNAEMKRVKKSHHSQQLKEYADFLSLRDTTKRQYYPT